MTDPFTKEMLDDKGEYYHWDVLEYDEENLNESPINPHNGFDVLDFLNMLREQYQLKNEQLKQVERLIWRKVPAINEPRQALAQWLLKHLEN